MDVSEGPAQVQVRARITDNLSGVKASAANFRSDANHSIWFQSVMQRESGDQFDGVYTATVTIPQGAAPGDWSGHLVFLQDQAGNSHSWESALEPLNPPKLNVGPRPVNPGLVHFADEDGTAEDTYTVPLTEGVKYLVNGEPTPPGTYPGAGTITVTARATNGFVLQSGAPKEWALDFSAHYADISVPASLVSIARTSPDVVRHGDQISFDWEVRDRPATAVVIQLRDSLGNDQHQVRWDGGPAFSGTATATVNDQILAAGELKISSISISSGATGLTYTDTGTVHKQPAGTKDPVPAQLDLAASSFVLGDPLTFNPASDPTLGGDPVVGTTLTIRGTTFNPSPAKYSYKWFRDGAMIPDAATDSYTLAGEDGGKRISATVTAEKPGYEPATVTTTATGPVLFTFSSVTTPGISGRPEVGQVLSANAGIWVPAPETLAYQWFRSGKAIEGATDGSLMLMPADVGQELTVGVTGTRAGYLPVTQMSAATFKTTPLHVAPAAVVFTDKDGTAEDTYTVPATQGVDYLLNGAVIAAGTYPGTGTVTVTANAQTGYLLATGAPVSWGTTFAAAPLALSAPVPTVTGTAVVGSVLTAVPGIWGPVPVALAYQWKANGVIIIGATAGTYKPVAADAGKNLTVTVTGTKAGYSTAARTSTATAKIV